MKNHYQVLGLAWSGDPLDQAVIKSAYHQALLESHPDKQNSASGVRVESVQDIRTAYKVLTENQDGYIEFLKRRLGQGTKLVPVGGDIVDLDDMVLDDVTDSSCYRWTLDCRCGEEYFVSEEDLESNGSASEIKVPCTGCSLWIVVHYSQIDEQ